MKVIDSKDTDTLMTFPCQFEVKAMGHNDSELEQIVVGIVRRHLPVDAPYSVRSHLSRTARYKSLTISFTATDRAQLDAMYQDLTDEPIVLVAL
ncbi:MAG: UPF0250 protein [marine bacterium B5-7]|nr:MAG: UPF0250 protein [marine bacterium B5-7]